MDIEQTSELLKKAMKSINIQDDFINEISPGLYHIKTRGMSLYTGEGGVRLIKEFIFREANLSTNKLNNEQTI